MKKFLKGLIILVTIPAIIVYVLSCLTPHISPHNFWPMTFLALGFPFTAIGFFFLVITWFFFKPKTAILLLLVFLIGGYKNLPVVFGIDYFSSFKPKKENDVLRVITWNVKYFDNAVIRDDHPDSIRRRMINYLEELNADVMCFQEFVEIDGPGYHSNIKVFTDTLGYPYTYFTRDETTKPSDAKIDFGVIIFSKYPIKNAGRQSFDSLGIKESIGFADINYNGKNVRLMTTHLQSMGLFNGDQIQREGRFINHDKILTYGESKLGPLRFYDSVHVSQAFVTRHAIDASPYPVIFTADLNSIPSSYVYHKIRGDLKDAFVAKGRSFGSSFQALSPTLRIDVILADKAFEVVQFQTPKLFLSDHFPVIADLRWKAKN